MKKHTTQSLQKGRTRTVGFCEPASSLISRFDSGVYPNDGASRLSEGTGIKLPTIQRWRRPRSNGGTGGYIHYRHHKVLKEFGNSIGVQINDADLLYTQD